MAFADGAEHFVVEQVVAALRKRGPRLGLHALFLHKSGTLPLLLERVHLHLVHSRRDVVEGLDVHQPIRMKVADPNGAQLACAVRVFHGAPGAVDISKGLVNQVQVQVVQLQACQRLVDGLLGALVTRVLHPQLGRDEQVCAGHAAVANASTDRRFVGVRGSGVDEAIAGLDGVHHAARALLRIRDLENTKSQHRHLDAVIQSCFQSYRVHRGPVQFVWP